MRAADWSVFRLNRTCRSYSRTSGALVPVLVMYFTGSSLESHVPELHRVVLELQAAIAAAAMLATAMEAIERQE